jgi:uncharacterized protein YndB with AHSA1/START domain
MDDTQNSATVNLIVRRTIRAKAERLFAAWTEPDQIKAWWGPANVSCSAAEIDLQVGGSYRIANKMPDGKVLWITGEFLRIEPPRVLVYSWRLEPGGNATERVTVRFDPRGDATDVIVLHEQIADATVRDRHEQGWHGCLDGLAEHVEAG